MNNDFLTAGCDPAIRGPMLGPNSDPHAKGSNHSGSNCYSPDVGNGGTLTTYDYNGYSDKNSNCSSSLVAKDSPAHLMPQQHPGLSLSQAFAEVRPRSEHLYEQPMVVFPSQQQKKVGGGGSSNVVDERTPFVDKMSSASSSECLMKLLQLFSIIYWA